MRDAQLPCNYSRNRAGNSRKHFIAKYGTGDVVKIPARTELVTSKTKTYISDEYHKNFNISSSIPPCQLFSKVTVLVHNSFLYRDYEFTRDNLR